jgi:hypothetical protein
MAIRKHAKANGWAPLGRRAEPGCSRNLIFSDVEPILGSLMQPLYALILVIGFGADGLELKVQDNGRFLSKGNCESELERQIEEARDHGGLAKDGVRFGGACVLMESR